MNQTSCGFVSTKTCGERHIYLDQFIAQQLSELKLKIKELEDDNSDLEERVRSLENGIFSEG